MNEVKGLLRSKTFHGILLAALGFLAGPEALPLLEPIFGGTLPGWMASILKAVGLLFALYGRITAKAQIVGVATRTEPSQAPIERRV